jgi:glyoxylase-like metal-dependent hydrolase (beta-lactamase superfamily II)
MYFRQLQVHGDNFSYIIADPVSRHAAVVDSSYNAAEIIEVLKSEGFLLMYIFCTHGHSDHIAGNMMLHSELGGQIVAHSLSNSRSDIKVKDGEIFTIGNIPIKVLYTPGHTPDGICLLVDDKKLLTGDTLFIGECGRVDLPGGNAEHLYYSLFDKLLRLSDTVDVYPGHNYGPKPASTLGEQRRTNYVLTPRSLPEFIEFMNEP